MPVADPTVLHVPATRRLASGLLALALLLLQLAPVAAAEITTDLWIYQYGDTVTVTGVDFGTEETVEIVTTDPYAVEVDRGTAQTDLAGGFTYQFVLLSDVPGIYDVVATGLTSGLVANTQFDPPNFGATLTAAGISPSTVDYSDNVSFSGNFTCTDNSGPATNKCSSSYTGLTVDVQLNIGGFTTVATRTGLTATFSIPCATACTSPWTVEWQAGKYGVNSVAPGAYSVRASVSGLGSGTVNSAPVASGLTITKEDTASEYLGDTNATEGTSLNLSADVDDSDHGVGAGNDEFLPDTNLQSTVSAIDGVEYQLWTTSTCGGSSAAGPAYDDVDDFGSASGATLSLAPVSAGTYYLKTSYLGNTFYLGSSVCDAIGVTSADSTPPTITLVTPANGSATNDTSPSLSGVAGTAAGDSATVQIKVYNGVGTGGTLDQTQTTTRNAITGAYAIDASALAEGTYTGQAQQSDSASNTGYSSANTFIVDLTDPIATITGTPDDPTNSTAAVFTFTSNDPTSGGVSSGVDYTECQVDAGGYATCSSGTDFGPMAEGSHTFDVRAVDNAGNVGPPDSYAWVVDTTPPNVEITFPADGSSTIALTTAVSGTVSDTSSGVASVSVNDWPATLGPGTFLVPSVPLNCGSNTLTALATDNAGNTATDSITVTRICFSNLQYHQPLDQTVVPATPVINSGKYGRIIPTKITFTLADGTVVTDAVAAANGWTIEIGVNNATCATGASDSVEAYADAGQSSSGTNMFRWTGGQWVYNLDTKAPPQMTMLISNCYRLDVYIDDGTSRVKISTSTYAVFKPVR